MVRDDDSGRLDRLVARRIRARDVEPIHLVTPFDVVVDGEPHVPCVEDRPVRRLLLAVRAAGTVTDNSHDAPQLSSRS